MEFVWIHQRHGKHHVSPYNNVVIEDEQCIQELRKRQVLADRHDEVVEETDRVHHQHRRKDFPKLVAPVMPCDKRRTTEQHTLCEAGHETERQNVKKISKQVGKSTFFYVMKYSFYDLTI